MRRKLLLSRFDLNEIATTELTLKVAETDDEILQALNIHYKSYLATNLIKDQRNPFRLTKYQLLPSSTILVAKKGNKVVGTLSVIGRGELGLPIESGWDIQSLTNKYAAIYEISAMAVDLEYPKNPGEVLFPLLKFMFEYTIDYLNAEAIICVFNKLVEPFCRDILCCKPIKSFKGNYKLVRDSKPLAYYMDARKMSRLYKKVYAKHSNKTNLYKYFFTNGPSKNTIFPEREYFKSSDYRLTPRLIKKAIDNNFNFKELNLIEKENIANALSNPSLIVAAGLEEGVPRNYQRSSARVTFFSNGVIQDKKCNLMYYTKCINVSTNGLKVKVLGRKLECGTQLELRIPIADKNILRLNVQVVSKQQENTYGLQLNNVSKQWIDFIEHQQSSIKQFKETDEVA